jgi:hypothetical protein
MPKVYLLLTKTGSLISYIISKFTHDKYNHVSLCIDDTLTNFYSFSRKHPKLFFWAGFVVEHLDRGIYEYFKETECALYSLEVDVDKFKLLKNFTKEYRINGDSYGYNIAGLFGIAINRPVSRKKHFFCSQFVATLFRDSGIYRFKKHIALVTPNDFAEIPDLNLIYEGKLSQFRQARNHYNHQASCEYPVQG